MALRRHICGWMWVVVWGWSWAGQGAVPRDSVPLVDLSRSAAELDARNYRLEYRLEGGGEYGRGVIDVIDGMIAGAEGGKVVALKRDGNELRGQLRLGNDADAYRFRAVISDRLELYEAARSGAGREIPGPTLPARFYPVEGTWKKEAPVVAEGRVVGRILPPHRPGHFSAGRYRNGALHFSFDMGQARRPWHFSKLAMLELGTPADLSGFRGWRLWVDTDQPRDDVSLSLWMREADGSWYYLRSAVPLAGVRNFAEVLFEDFGAAGWVAPSPGTEGDEDGFLDLRSISHVAIGVIEPAGVGVVDFALRGLEVVARRGLRRDPAIGLVSGKLLSVNGEERSPLTRGMEKPTLISRRTDRGGGAMEAVLSSSIFRGDDQAGYWGDSLTAIAELEVGAAFAVGRFGQWRHEAIRPTRLGGVKEIWGDFLRMSREFRDVLGAFNFCPDKARFKDRMLADDVAGGVAVARQLLGGLEGRLVETESSDPRVWVVSTVSGDGAGAKLVVLVFNDHLAVRDVALTMRAPEGTRFRDGLTEWTFLDPAARIVEGRSRRVAAEGSESQSVAIQLAPRSVWKVTYSLAGELDEETRVERRQFFAEGTFRTVRRRAPLRTTVEVYPEWLEGVRAGWLSVVLERVGDGEGLVRIGGETIELPRTMTNDRQMRLVRVPVSVKALGKVNEVVFEVVEGFDGYRVNATSLMLER